MSKEFHIEMIDSASGTLRSSNIEDYTKRYTTATGSQQRCIVRGMCDIVRKDIGMYSAPYNDYSVTNNDYWIMLGNLNDEAIVEVFDDSYFGVDDGIEREGCYE